MLHNVTWQVVVVPCAASPTRNLKRSVDKHFYELPKLAEAHGNFDWTGKQPSPP